MTGTRKLGEEGGAEILRRLNGFRGKSMRAGLRWKVLTSSCAFSVVECLSDDTGSLELWK